MRRKDGLPHVKPLNKGQRREVVRRYSEGESAFGLAAGFGVCFQTIYNYLRREGVSVRKHEASETELTQMAEMYRGGFTLKEAASKFGYDVSVAQRAISLHGIQSRTNSEAHRVYSLNEKFFSSIDNEEKAYWLGFIAADGCVHKNSSQVTVTLSAVDRSHLEKFQRALETDAPLFDYEVKDSRGIIRQTIRLTLCSRTLQDSLARAGVRPAKSHTIAPWNGPPCLMPHYWRGVVDGDGSIVRYYPERSATVAAWRVGLVGSKKMCDGFLSFSKEHYPTSATVHPKGTIFQVLLGGIHLAQTMCRVLYANSSVCLNRKGYLASQCLAQAAVRRSSRQFTQRLA